ncbi:interleukin 15, like isoform X3 [Phycodurus eques]|uniref:interleukin 15, like isoform X3 n=1 Tax=Phycodurus eques TaxID=693459 RepID=UPI002ACD6B2C|nr:interleukin 15, like isoform X3 [Phycodurus eques]
MLRGRPAAFVTVWCLAWLLCDGAHAFSRDAVHQCADCKLYTPSVSDYKTCPKDTLKCFSAEVRVLLAEWEGSQQPDLERALRSFADQRNHVSGREVASSNTVSGGKRCHRARERAGSDVIVQRE